MSTDFFTEIIKQAPAIGVLLVALYVVYSDWRKDRENASAQREQMIEQLTYNTVALQTLATKLNIQLPTQQEVKDNTHRLRDL